MTFVNAEGEETVIELPTAASRITSLSVNKGEETNINKVEEDTLSSYPITIEESTVDMSSLMQSMSGENTDNAENKVSVRVNPVDVDATAIEFVAINGKNEVLSNVTFVANEDKKLQKIVIA